MRVAGSLTLDGSSLVLGASGTSTTLASGSPGSPITVTLPDSAGVLVPIVSNDITKLARFDTTASNASTTLTIATPASMPTSTFTLPSPLGSNNLVTEGSNSILSNKELTSPTLTDNGTNPVTLTSNSTTTGAGRTLTFNINDASKTIDLAGNFTTSGGGDITLASTNTITFNLPLTSGLTAATLDGASESFTTTKTFTQTISASNATPIDSSDQSVTLFPTVGTTGAGTKTITLGSFTDASNFTKVVIPGDLEVQGTTTTVATTNLDVADANITVNDGGSDTSAEGAGITVERVGTDGSLIYADAATSKFKIGALGTEIEVADISSSQTLSSKILTGNEATSLTSNSNTVTLPDPGGDGDTAVYQALNQPISNKDINLGTATNTNKIVPSRDTNTNLTALTREEGSVYYDNDAQGLVVDNGTDLVPVGSGSGSGGINYIDNPQFEVGTPTASPDATWGNWAVYDDGATAVPITGAGGGSITNITLVERTGVNALRDKKSGGLQAEVAATQGMGWAHDFTIDPADFSKQLFISFDYDNTNNGGIDVGVYIYNIDTATLVYPAFTELTQGASTKFQTSFVTDSSSTNYRLILHLQTSNSTSIKVLTVDNVRVGPETEIQGVPVTDWEDFTADVVVNGFTAPYLSNGALVAKKRIGDTLYVRGRGRTISPVATPWSIQIPDNLTIDTSKLEPTTGSYNKVGFANRLASTAIDAVTNTNPSFNFHIYYDGNNTDRVAIAQEVTSRQYESVNAGSLINNADEFNFEFSVPIAEWAQSAISQSNSQVEYASNSDISATALVTGAGFAYGPSGSEFGAGWSTGTEFVRRVKFLTPIQATDKITIQVSDDSGTTWADIGIGVISSYMHQGGTNKYGVYFLSVNSTDIDVYFGNQGRISNSATYGGAGDPFSSLSGGTYKWRVVKSANPLSIGSFKSTKWQEKILTTSVISGLNAAVTELDFNNLSPGKTYRLTLSTSITANSTAQGANVTYRDGASFTTGNLIIANKWRTKLAPDASEGHFGNSVIFKAQTSTLKCGFFPIAGTCSVQATVPAKFGSWAMLEELPLHEETTQWT